MCPMSTQVLYLKCPNILVSGQHGWSKSQVSSSQHATFSSHHAFRSSHLACQFYLLKEGVQRTNLGMANILLYSLRIDDTVGAVAMVSQLSDFLCDWLKSAMANHNPARDHCQAFIGQPCAKMRSSCIDGLVVGPACPSGRHCL